MTSDDLDDFAAAVLAAKAPAGSARLARTPTRSKADPDALRWQSDREQVEKALDFLDRLIELRRQEGKPPLSDKQAAGWLRKRLLGGEGCVIAPFDHRIPAWWAESHGTVPAPSLGEQLDEIMRDMDAAYAAVRAAKAGFDSPEYEAVEAVYVRLRAWNAAAAAR